jgi:hypothetical protein
MGVAGQGYYDLSQGNDFHWENYASAGIGGGVNGVLMIYTGPGTAGVGGAAVGNISRQYFEWLNGRRTQGDLTLFILETGEGALLGRIPGQRIPGLTTGSNSCNALFRSMRTHIRNGTWRNVSWRTGGRAFGGRALEGSLFEGLIISPHLGDLNNSLLGPPARVNDLPPPPARRPWDEPLRLGLPPVNDLPLPPPPRDRWNDPPTLDGR